MGLGRERLIGLALLALDDVAEAALAEPVARSFPLRFLLAWLWQAAGARPESRWLYDQFWLEATRRQAHGGQSSAYTSEIGRTALLQAALNGICREAGYERTHEAEVCLRELRARVRP